MKWYLVVSICISLMVNDSKLFFQELILYNSFGEILIQIFCPFIIVLHVLLIYRNFVLLFSSAFHDIIFLSLLNMIYLNMGLCGKNNCLAQSGMVYVRSLLPKITRWESFQMCAAAFPTVLLTFWHPKGNWLFFLYWLA